MQRSLKEFKVNVAEAKRRMSREAADEAGAVGEGQIILATLSHPKNFALYLKSN